MKKEKLSLSQLKVTSFITTDGDVKGKGIKPIGGGNSDVFTECLAECPAPDSIYDCTTSTIRTEIIPCN